MDNESKKPKLSLYRKLADGRCLWLQVWPGKKDVSTDVVVVRLSAKSEAGVWSDVERISAFRDVFGEYVELTNQKNVVAK